MEWKEEGLKAIYIGGIAWVGSLFVKKLKPIWVSIKRGFSLSDRVDTLEKDMIYAKRQIIIEESKLMALLHTSVDPAFIVNTNGDMIYANPAWQKMTGFTNLKDAYQKGYIAAIPFEDRDELEKVSDRIVDHPSSFEGIQRFRYLHPPHNIIITECRTELVKDDEDVLIEIVGRLKIIS